MQNERNLHEDVKVFIEELKIEYKAEFVPKVQTEKKIPQLHWRITLKTNHGVMECDYREGIGHVIGYRPNLAIKSSRTIYEQEEYEMWRKTCETGILYWIGPSRTVYAVGKPNKQPPPKLIDVLYALVMDSDVVSYSTFEDWAESMGYDADSRKAEKIYHACLENFTKLRSVIGGLTIDKLQELYQDY